MLVLEDYVKPWKPRMTEKQKIRFSQVAGKMFLTLMNTLHHFFLSKLN